MQKGIFKTTLMLTALSTLSYLVKYLFNLYMARHLSAVVYGDLSIALQALTIAGSIMLLGSDASAKRFLPGYFEKGDFQSTISFIAWSMRTLLTTSLIAIVLTFLMLAAAYALDYFKIYSLDNYHLAFKMLWLSPLLALILLFSSILLSHKHYFTSTFFQMLGRNLFFLAGFFIAINYFQLSLSGNIIISIIFICFVILLALELTAINLQTPIKFPNHLHSLFRQQKAPEHWKKTSLQLTINNIVYAFLAAADLFMVEIFSSNEEMAGYYAACLTIAGFIWLIPQGTQQILKPQIHVLIEAKQFKALQELIHKVNLIQLALLSITTTLLIIFSKTLLGHFGRDYINSAPALIILLIGFCLGGYLKTANSFLMYSGLESILAKITIFEFTYIIITGIPLIYFFGLIGAALSTITTIIISGMIAIYFARKNFKELRVCSIL